MKEYVVTIDGIDHTVLLDEEEAKVRNAKPKGGDLTSQAKLAKEVREEQAKDAAPANKSRTTQVRAK